MMLVPRARHIRTPVCGFISVGKPGYGIVLTLVRRSSPVRPERFNPYAGKTHGQTGRNTPKAPLTVLRDVFCRKGRGGEIKMTERIERPGEGR